jgi:hypothetical protein
MNDVAVESNLQYFRNRVSVKGDSVLARAKFILDRWEKVIDDCQKSNDQSTYRVLFSNSHKEPAELLRKLIDRNLSNEDLSKHVKMLKYKYLSIVKGCNNVNSVTDALFLIILELEAAEDIPNV